MRNTILILFILFFTLFRSETAKSTFSICAIDPVTGEVGSAGASCIANCLILSYVQPGWGVVHVQASWLQGNYNYASYLMQQHYSPLQIRDSLVAHDYGNNPTVRQYGMVDLTGGGRTAAYTGVNCTNYKNHIIGPTYTIQGNILLGQKVLDSMEARFNRQQGTLADKLMAALQGAKMVGADTRCNSYGKSAISAFLRVAKPGDTLGTYYCNLVVPNTPTTKDPIDSLQTLFNNWHVTNISYSDEEIPARPELYQNFPNPFNPLTKIKFAINSASFVTLKVYNSIGKNIAVLINENMNEGVYYSPFGASDLPSGVYFYTLETRDLRTGNIFKESKKMLIVK